MVSTFTANKGLEEPGRGDQVGVWDTPVNSNMTVLDNALGTAATINVAAGSVVLSTAQYRNAFLVLNSTLIASITLTFPINVGGYWTIDNVATGSSAFTTTLQTTAAGAQAILCPPGEVFDIKSDGTNIKFRNLGRVGEYWDYAGSSVPAWISGCTIPPYLNCDGTAFSSATYPALTMVLGGTTLPDSKGRARFALNQGSGRITSAGGGIDGNTALAGGGAQTNTLGSSNLPASIPYTDPQHQHGLSGLRKSAQQAAITAGGGIPNVVTTNGTDGALGVATDQNPTSITINSGSANTAITNLPPGYIGGLTLIRAG